MDSCDPELLRELLWNAVQVQKRSHPLHSDVHVRGSVASGSDGVS